MIEVGEYRGREPDGERETIAAHHRLHLPPE
jgi:hypothetical protein